MLALSDNDIICKLVSCGLFDDALALCGCTRADVRVLRSSKWVVGKRAKPGSRHRKSIVATYGDATAAAIGELLETLAEVPAPSAQTDRLLVNIGIDPGEAQLLRVAYEDRDTIIATSDKRALETLLSDETCQPVRSAVAGRIVVFETLLLGLIARHGYAWVTDRVARVAATEGMLRLAFSNGPATSEAHAVECLSSYSKHLAPLLRNL